MAVVKNLMVRAGADFSALIRAANRASSSVGKMQKSMSSSFSRIERSVIGIKRVLGTLGVAVSFGALINAAKEAKEAYDESAAAEARLQQVMRNTMGASDAEIRSIKELTAAQQALGVVGDDVQQAGAQELATYLSRTSALKKLIPVMNDMLAQQYGFSASQENAANIATMLGKVMNGQTGALSRYGYSFTKAQEAVLKTGTEMERAAVLAEVVEASVGGMNAALANTPTGRLAKLKNTLGDIKEEFGRATTTLLTVFLPGLQRVASGLGKIADFSNRVAQTIAKVFGGGKSQPAAAYSAELNDAADGAATLTDGLSGAEKAAKKLAMADIDNLHILKFGKDSGGESEDSGASDAPALATGGFLPGAEEEPETIGWLEKGLERIRSAAEKLKMKEFGDKLKELGGAFGYVASVIGEKLGWAYEHILVPLGAWGADRLLQTLDWMIDRLTLLGDLLSGKISFGTFLGELSGLEVALLAIGAVIGGAKFLGAITGLVTNIGKLLGPLKLFGGKIAEVFALVSSGCGTVSEAVAAVFGPGSALAGVAMVIGGIAVSVGEFFSMWNDGFSWLKEALMVLGIALAAVGAIILGVPAGIAAAVAGVVAAVATAAILIRQHWDEIVLFFKNSINSVLGFVENIINAVIATFNLVKMAINSLQIKIPQWVPGIGGRSVGFNLPMTKLVTIPRLATGAVIPPNREFMAVLGDQTSGNNIETPERLLREIMRQEMGGTRILALLMELIREVRAGKVLKMDSKTVGRTLREELSREEIAWGL